MWRTIIIIKAQKSKQTPWVRRIQGSINDIRTELSMLVEIKGDNRKVQNIKRTRLFKKYNIEKEEDLNRLIEKLRQKVAAKTQRLSRYRKRQNQCYQNMLFGTDCKKFYNQLRQRYSSVKMYQKKKKWTTFGENYMGIKLNIIERRAG
jgi:hypothetical protein